MIRTSCSLNIEVWTSNNYEWH